MRRAGRRQRRPLPPRRLPDAHASAASPTIRAPAPEAPHPLRPPSDRRRRCSGGSAPSQAPAPSAASARPVYGGKERKDVVSGQGVAGRIDLGGRRSIKKKK